MRVAYAVVAVAAALALLGAGATPATGLPLHPAAPRPSPSSRTRALPTPTDSVAPDASVGGPRLASMGVVVDAPAGVPRPPRLKDVAWIVVDAETGEVLAAKAPHARLRPASTVKALTAVTLLPRLDPHATHVATRAEASADGTRVGLLPGRRYTVRQLFQGLIMASGNDAAYALATVNGGMPATVAQVNATARGLGAFDTHVADPSGLDAPGQRSSAYDLALIGRAALRTKGYTAYATTREVTFPGKKDKKTKKRTSYKVGNHNALLWNYPGTIGVKNGFTVKAQRTFIAAARRGGRTYLVAEMYGIDYSWRGTARMLDWAFRYGERVRPVGRLVEPGEVAAPRGSSPSATAPAPTLSTSLLASPGDRATAAVAAAPPVARRPEAPWVAGGTLAAVAALVLGLALRARRGRARRHG